MDGGRGGGGNNKGQKLRVTLVRNVRRTDSRVVMLREEEGGGELNGSLFKQARQAAAGKMRIPYSQVRLFDTSGKELQTEEDARSSVHACTTLLVSSGESCFMDSSSASGSKKNTSGKVVVIANQSLVEDDAIQQLRHVAGLPGVVLAVGLPDLHAGASCPIGAAVATQGMIYPSLVGSDIGCGMLLARTSLPSSAASKSRTLDRWADSIQLEDSWDGNCSEMLEGAGVNPTQFDYKCFGTVGRGNHFAELQVVERIEDRDAAAALGLTTESVYVCVHSSSRGYGESILSAHSNQYGGRGISLETEGALEYIEAHNQACKWAKLNRRIIATRLVEQLQTKCTHFILDITHNNVVKLSKEQNLKAFGMDELGEEIWLHRKGAAPTDQGPVVIPGSRGAFSYIVLPSVSLDGTLECTSGWSLAHGAGRQLGRTAARVGGKARHPDATKLLITELQSRVVCDDKSLLYEERPEAYKDASCVMADLISAGLCEVVAVMKPVLTYKMRNIHCH